MVTAPVATPPLLDRPSSLYTYVLPRSARDAREPRPRARQVLTCLARTARFVEPPSMELAAWQRAAPSARWPLPYRDESYFG